MLTVIEGVLGADEAAQARSLLDQADWGEGAQTAAGGARHAKRNQQLPEGAEPGATLATELLARVSAHPLFISAALPRRIYPPRFNRYAGGGTYGAHVDSALMRRPDDDGPMRTDLSATLFLSPPTDYDGGVLEIETPFGAQSVKLNAGDLVLYPANSLHQVTPVTRGARLAAFFWIESLVRDEGERALLFDLDQTIQRLSASLGAGDGEVVRLGATYHNLLRRWAVS